MVKTEGIKYAGSKRKLLGRLLELIAETEPKTVLDGFAGTTRVSQGLAQAGYRVIVNDRAVWSEVFAHCYLKNTKPREYYLPILEHLNALKPIDGWFTEHYGGESSPERSASGVRAKKPWQRHNTRKLDAVREEIDRLRLPHVETCVLLTSLILALDSVDSTLGHYASYLNDWSPRSYGNLQLECPRFCATEQEHRVYRKDIFELLPEIEADLAYFDPPYGSNNEKMPPSRVRYASYYHLWTTVCLNDRPELFGKANRRVDTSDLVAGSVFEEFRRNEQGRFIAVEAIRRLIAGVKTRYVLLSYSSVGKATARELEEVIDDVGSLVQVVEIDYQKNVMAGMRWTNQWIREVEEKNRELLFLIRKENA